MKRLLKVILDDFKGVRHGEFDISGDRVIISGPNGSGKTTVFDGHLWLWADKDAALKSNPNIRPDDGRECTPTVTEEWNVDGTKVTICKMQKMKKGKPDENGVSKVSLQNTYAINSVPKTQRDFIADLLERGFDFDHFLTLSHADVFTAQKNADMRKILFDMASDMTDYDIASQTDGCEKVAELLESYRLDEIAAMQKATKKKADEQIKKIPGVIEGLEMSKVDDNSAELNKQITEIKASITALREEVNAPSKNQDELEKANEEEQKLRQKAADRREEVFAEWHAENSVLNEAYRAASGEERSAMEAVQSAKNELDSIKRIRDEAANKVAELTVKYKTFKRMKPSDEAVEALRAKVMPDNLTVCPTCQRALPESKAKKAVAKYEADHKKALEEAVAAYEKSLEVYNTQLSEIAEEGKAAAEKRDSATKKVEKATKDYGIAIEQYGAKKSALDKARAALDSVESAETKLSKDKKFKTLTAKIAAIKEKKLELRDLINAEREERDEKSDQIAELEGELEGLKMELATIEGNKRIDSQIAAQESLLRNFAQAKADAEELLDQIDMVGKRKNELLAESINSHFKVVRWKLFDYLKNGEYTEVCIPEVFDTVHQEWRAIGSTANTALEIIGKLDIVRGFQNFYESILPVFLDGAERLDTESMKRIDMPCQMIFLRVNDGELAVSQT